MPRKTETAVVIDPGKNTLHMIGLDGKGAIILREKVSRPRIADETNYLQIASHPACNARPVHTAVPEADFGNVLTDVR